MDVYTYDKWADKFLPNFEEGEQFRPTICEIREGETTQPNLLMDAEGIEQCTEYFESARRKIEYTIAVCSSLHFFTQS